MKLTKTLATIAVAGALSVAGLAAVTIAAGPHALAYPGSSADGAKGKGMCDRERHGGHDRHGRYGPPPRGPEALAERLSAMETKIGIRAEQLDDWRNFTDALQATMTPPFGPPGGPAKPGSKDSAEPFSLPEGLADRTIERADEAEKLKAAIAKLRTTLTSEQLEQVTEIEQHIRGRMARHHGGKHGHGGRHAPPQASPDKGSDTPEAPDDEGDDT